MEDNIKYISAILMSLLFINNINAKDILFEAYGISAINIIEISDNYKFSAYTFEGMCDDNNHV